MAGTTLTGLAWRSRRSQNPDSLPGDSKTRRRRGADARADLLFLNWMDIRNPDAGGAEVYLHHMLAGLAEEHSVRLFTSRFSGAAIRETIDGYHVVRTGNRFTVYLRAYLYYFGKLLAGNRPDAVVEVINSVPFFTPAYPGGKRLAVIFQLTQESWFYKNRHRFLCRIGYWLEKGFLPFYRGMPVVTISDSTRRGLAQAGIHRVRLVPIGIPQVTYNPAEKNLDALRIIHVGGLRRQKRIDHVMEAFAEINRALPDSQLWIVGSGDQLERLKLAASRLDRPGQVTFFGRVGEERKRELLGQANLMLVASVKEGWGLVVTEASSFGVPVIGYRVDGIVDSITEGVNGMLAEANEPRALAAAALRLAADKERFCGLVASSLEDARRYSWPISVALFREVVKREIL